MGAAVWAECEPGDRDALSPLLPRPRDPPDLHALRGPGAGVWGGGLAGPLAPGPKSTQLHWGAEGASAAGTGPVQVLALSSKVGESCKFHAHFVKLEERKAGRLAQSRAQSRHNH